MPKDTSPHTRDEHGLTPIQERLCQAYVIKLSYHDAALDAGYAESVAKTNSSQLKEPAIAARIAQLQKEKINKLELTAERVLREVMLLAFSNVQDLSRADDDGDLVIDLSKATRDHLAAVQEFTVDSTGGSGDGERLAVTRRRLKLADKTKALELLARHLKLLTDKVEVTGLDELAERIAGARKAIAGGSDAE